MEYRLIVATQFIGDDDEIPRWNRDRFWKCNLVSNGGEFPRWKRDNYGNANGFAFVMKFQCGKEIIVGNAVKPKSMMKFQWETDQYSTELNIQKPSVESRFWEEKK